MNILESEVQHSSHSNEFTHPLPGQCELAQLMRSLDWAKTSLPAPAYWPDELLSLFKFSLTSAMPSLILWGSNSSLLYNNAYKIFLNSMEHPFCLGQNAAKALPALWSELAPLVHQVFTTGRALVRETCGFLLSRHRPLEEVFVHLTINPIFASKGKDVKGVFCVFIDQTEQVVNARRLSTLRHLEEFQRKTANVMDAIYNVSHSLSCNTQDIPFAAIYLLDEDRTQAILNSTTGLKNGSSLPAVVPISLLEMPLTWISATKELTPSLAVWISAVVNGGKMELVDYLPVLDKEEPNSTEQVLILPIKEHEDLIVGVLILGVNAHCAFNEAYRSFFNSVGKFIAKTLSDTKVYALEKKVAEELLEQDRAKNNMFRTISHEFRTPLTLIMGTLEKIFELESNDTVLNPEDLHLVYRNAQRLLKLVDNLLDFTRLETDQMQIQFEPYNLSLFTRELASTFRSTIEGAGLTFKVECFELSESIYIDPALWEKIVLNLISNAFKFTFSGTIILQLHERSDEAVELIIKDSGIGIAHNELPYLFNRFQCIKSTRGRTLEGSGMGLPLVKELVALHKGTVQVISEVNRGTTFTVTLQKGSKHLPSVQVMSGGKKEPHDTQKMLFIAEAVRWYMPEYIEARTPNNLKSANILVADDNADMREYLSRLLGKHWKVETVANGALALEKIKIRTQNSLYESPYDLIVLDLIMPGLNGFQLLQILKSDPITNEIPVIMLSGRAEEGSRLEGLKKGADDYLVKPFSSEELIVRVETILKLTVQRRLLIHELNIMNYLHSIATRFVQEADVSSIFLEIIDAAMFITNADKGSILLVNEVAQTLSLKASRGFDASLSNFFSQCSAGEGACGVAFQKPERVIIYDLRNDERFKGTSYLAELLAKGVQAIQATPLTSRTGKILGILATYYNTPLCPKSRELQMVDLLARLSADIIERGQWLAERAMLVEKLRAADKRKNEFLALLSHELRNPIASISNSAMLLSHNTQGSKEVHSAHAIINRQVAQITRLVDDLLDITRITENKIQLNFQRINVNELIMRIVEDNRSVFDRADLKLCHQTDEKTMFIRADELRIEQVLNNLLHNALKFSSAGGGIHVFTEQDKKLEQVVIRVIDEGIGIEPSFTSQLFNPFTQADNSLERTQGGLGLGLALVKGLIDLHKGNVSVFSKGLGYGAEFTIRLPQDKSLDIAQPFLIEKTCYQGIKRTILVIDDNKDVAESLCMLLESLGHIVHIARDGFEGLNNALKIMPDCVLCDIGLPGLNGYQVAEAFKSNSKLRDIYLIALSGYAQPEEVQKALEAGFNTHLAKPPNFTVLENLLFTCK